MASSAADRRTRQGKHGRDGGAPEGGKFGAALEEFKCRIGL